MPRIGEIRDDPGASTVISSAPVDLSSDVGATLPERTASAIGSKEISQPEPVSVGGSKDGMKSRACFVSVRHVTTRINLVLVSFDRNHPSSTRGGL